ncbi:MAG: ribose-phosphate pyrophosphokinase [Verrucomicrobiota bacterium]
MSQTIFGNDLQIFSGSANRELAQKIADYLGVGLGEATVTSFPDGESFVRYEENIRGNDVFIVQPTSPPTNHHLMELFIMLDAARRASAQRITAVVPFYGYARQDRKDQPRVPITAKLVANLLATAGANRVLTMDLHAQQIQGFFDIPVDHLYAAPVFYEYLSKKNLNNPVVVSPDVGGMKMAAAYAEVLGAGLAIVAKRRVSATETKALYVVGEVKDSDVLIVDDMTETAGTVTSAAKILKESGARDIYAGISHAILKENGIERLKNSEIKELITTNTTPNPQDIDFPITVLGVETLLGEAIQRIHFGKSVSSLFEFGDGKKMGF